MDRGVGAGEKEEQRPPQPKTKKRKRASPTATRTLDVNGLAYLPRPRKGAQEDPALKKQRCSARDLGLLEEEVFTTPFATACPADVRRAWLYPQLTLEAQSRLASTCKAFRAELHQDLWLPVSFRRAYKILCERDQSNLAHLSRCRAFQYLVQQCLRPTGYFHLVPEAGRVLQLKIPRYVFSEGFTLYLHWPGVKKRWGLEFQVTDYHFMRTEGKVIGDWVGVCQAKFIPNVTTQIHDLQDLVQQVSDAYYQRRLMSIKPLAARIVLPKEHPLLCTQE